jgi:hypothetical protein
VGVMDDMFELMEAVDNILISRAMGWDLDGAFERLRVAKERVDYNNQEQKSWASESSPVSSSSLRSSRTSGRS